MRSFSRPRVIISAICTGVVAVALVAGAVVFTHGASAATESAVAHPITANPARQPAGTPTTGTGEVAHFSCQTPTAYATDGAIICYGPDQLQHAYGVDQLISQGITGAGHTIVIVDAFSNPLIATDLANFDSVFGLPAPASFSVVAPYGVPAFDVNDDNMVGWASEISLDVQWSHAIAPGAGIVLVEAPSNSDEDLNNVTRYAVEHHLGDVISMSFGENEKGVSGSILDAWHQTFVEAQAANITVLASSGDEGAAQWNLEGSNWQKVVSSPANDPLVTGVGGTELVATAECRTAAGALLAGCTASSPAAGTYVGETALNEAPGLWTDGSFSTGGGDSNVYKRPSFQTSVPNLNGNHRGVPDVSWNAAIGHGVIASFAVGGGYYIFGGTSAGAPAWAGLIALADQYAGHDIGYINDKLYAASASDFFDVTEGNNSVEEYDAAGNLKPVSGYAAAPGWDETTGLGSPKANLLIPYLAS